MAAEKYYDLDKVEYSEEETINYIHEMFDIWVEQKIIRAVCRDEMGADMIAKCDLKSVALRSDEQASKMHQLLTKGYAGNLMGIDTFSEDQYSLVLDDRKRALKNYMQALISLQEDPALQIKKLAEKVAK